MGVFQSYNERINAWVKGEIEQNDKGGKFFKALDVKQKKPKEPFKGVPIK